MFERITRVLITLVAVAVAAVICLSLWRHYMNAPWTRDGRVRADIIDVAPDVAGLVTAVAIQDNQKVSKGDVLLLVDRERYEIALKRAQAGLEKAQAALAHTRAGEARAQATLTGIQAEAGLKREEAERRAALDAAVVSKENLQSAQSAAQVAAAKVREAESELAAAHSEAAAAQGELAAARSELDGAQLNLLRTRVLSPVDGYVVNLNVHPGDYAAVGHPLLAVVDRHSFRVEAYFEENKLPLVQVGDKASVRLLGAKQDLPGHIEGMARAISQPDVAGLMSTVSPTFHWVRLAQRIPVTIRLDQVPDTLTSGLTCTVIVQPRQ